jgi:hypothetical protein
MSVGDAASLDYSREKSRRRSVVQSSRETAVAAIVAHKNAPLQSRGMAAEIPATCEAKA